MFRSLCGRGKFRLHDTERLPLFEMVFSDAQGSWRTHLGNFFGSLSQNAVLDSPVSESLENCLQRQMLNLLKIYWNKGILTSGLAESAGIAWNPSTEEVNMVGGRIGRSQLQLYSKFKVTYGYRLLTNETLSQMTRQNQARCPSFMTLKYIEVCWHIDVCQPGNCCRVTEELGFS